ncbi:uncharacterized protein [Atheta coriaria]|uniref:uncharacterized protein n=1 Tax=Dalotia coriaria TaxID=877792 RepID=UPI0031F3AF0C
MRDSTENGQDQDDSWLAPSKLAAHVNIQMGRNVGISHIKETETVTIPCIQIPDKYGHDNDLKSEVKPEKAVVQSNLRKSNYFIHFSLLNILAMTKSYLDDLFAKLLVLVLIAQAHGLELQNERLPILKWSYFENVSANTTNITFSNCSVSYVQFDAFCKFKNMTYLDFTGNNLKSFNIALNQLQVLNLADNKLTAIESKLLLNSPNLQELYLERNNLKSIDWNLNVHINLQKVILNENQLTTISLISPTLQELWIKFEDARVEFSAVSKMEQLTFLETSGTETDGALCWLSNSTLIIRSTKEDKICGNSTIESKTSVINFKKHQGLNCELSTLRVHYDDIVISKGEFYLTMMWLYALLATVIVLFITNCSVALMYVRSLNSKQRKRTKHPQIC